MMSFERLYSAQEQQAGPASPRLKPLMARFYAALVADPVDLAALKQSMLELLQFLTTPEGRTSANCTLVDFFICLGEWDWPDLPDDFNDIIADMSGALHDTVSAPEIAYNFDSTPEQLLERTQKLLDDA